MTNYEMLYIPEISSYLVIGGYSGDVNLAKIAQFKNGAWSDAGNLNSPRHVSFSLKHFSLFLHYSANNNYFKQY